MLKFCVPILILLFCGFTQEKAGIKVLTISDDPALEAPLRIDVYLHGKKIKSDVPFTANDNWIEDLQIWITNRTKDEIKFASFTLDFPTEHNGETMMKRFFITIGRAEALKRPDHNPEAEEVRIGGEAKLVTFNMNDPLAGEAFKQAKTKYDAKVFDKGVLSLYAVEFENRLWDRGFDFDRKPDGTWEKNKEKEKRLHERIKKEPQIGFLKQSFVGRPQALQCFTVPPPPRTGSTRSCSPASGCQSANCTYFRPSLTIATVGRKKVLTSPGCSGPGCGGCCEPNVPDLGAVCSN